MRERSRLSHRTLAAILATLCAIAPSAAQTSAPAGRAATPLREIPAAAATAPAAEKSIDDAPEVRRLVESARARLEDGKLKDALEKLDAARSAAGENRYFELSLLNCELRLQVGDLKHALEDAQTAASLRPTSVDAHYLLGSILAAESTYAEAIPHLRSATLATHDAGNLRLTLAWLRLGACLDEEGYWAAAAEALAEFDKAIWETNPEHRNAPELRAMLTRQPRGVLEDRLRLLARLGDAAAALRVTREALDRFPDDAYVARRHAYALIAAEHPQDAIKVCEEWFYKAGGIPGLLPPAIDAARAAGTLDAWIQSICDEVGGGRSFELGEALVPRLVAVAAHDAAIRLAAALQKAGRGGDDLPWHVAEAHWRGGRRGEAITTLATLARSAAGQRDISPWRIERWKRCVRSTGAEMSALVGEARRAADRDFAVDYVLGITALGCGNLALGESLLRSSLESRVDFTPAAVARLALPLAAFEWDAAKRDAAEVLKRDSNLASALLAQALAHDGLDENAQAEECLKRAIRVAPREPAYTFALAELQRRTGNLLGAQRFYAETIASDPLAIDARQALLDVFLATGKEELARQEYRHMETAGLPTDVLHRASLTLRYWRTPLAPQRIAELRGFFEADPTDVESARVLAKGQLVAGQVREAHETIDRALAHCPDDYLMQFLRVQAWAEEIEFGRCVELLEGLLKRYPSRREVLGYLAVYYEAELRGGDARKVLERLVQLDPESRGEYEEQILGTYEKTGEYEAGIAYVDARLAEAPAQREWLGVKLRLLALLDRGAEAFELARKELDLAEHDADARRRFVEVAVACKQYKVAEEKLLAWLKDAPDDKPLIELLLTTLCADGRGDDAFEHLSRFDAKDIATAVWKRRWMAKVRILQDQPEKAIVEIDALLGERGMADDRVRMDLLDDLRRALIAAGKYDRALEVGEQWIELAKFPDPTVVRLELRRQVFALADRMDEYTRTMEQLFELQPDNVGLNNDLGYSWVDQNKNVPRALGMIRRAVARDPLNAAYLDSLGWAYYKLGDFEKARIYVERSIKLPLGKDPVLHDHLGDALWRLGQKDAASAEWKLAAELAEKELKDAKSPRPDREKVLTSVRTKVAAAASGQEPSLAPLASAAPERAP